MENNFREDMAVILIAIFTIAVVGVVSLSSTFTSTVMLDVFVIFGMLMICPAIILVLAVAMDE